MASNTVAVESEVVKKQGSYGKVKIHKHSKLSQILRVNELVALVKLRSFIARATVTAEESSRLSQDKDVAFCDEMLGKVSRSFTLAIRQLPEELRLPVCVFYLALRGLDTIEDDMTFFAADLKEKVNQLVTFHEKLLDMNWTISGVGEGDERYLLEHYQGVSRVFGSLRPPFQQIIKDITRRMGKGMAEFIEKDMGEGTISKAEYDRYCYYVAGLVGEGLTSLFSVSGCESDEIAGEMKLAISMGLFLQKTNIIRDFLEDYEDGRAFWPQEVWKKYGKSLGDFKEPKNRANALACLNELVTDALEHIPECLQYLDLLHNDRVFGFCAVPQVMAIATLNEVFNNDKVFTGVVKIRKGMAANIMLNSRNVSDVHSWFVQFARSIKTKAASAKGPNMSRTLIAVEKVLDIGRATGHLEVNLITEGGIGLPVIFGMLGYYIYVRGSVFPPLTNTMDVAVLGMLFTVFTLLFALYGVPFVTSMVSGGPGQSRDVADKGSVHQKGAPKRL